ncbi:MAG: phosphatidylserine decarboxylase [Halobacteriales archaeon]|nr:phosphatidylserine decarboxylase [Halobacteriales archaeon]
MAFRLARGTWHWVATPALLGVFFLPIAPPASYALWLVALFLLNFFRDPERSIADGLCSPADGVVSRVQETEDGGHEVSIFMNLHNVHVNRAPCDGTVRSVQHIPGALKPAWHKDSDRNERVVWELDTPHGPVRVTQIAGLLARRIVPYAKAGQRLAKGERIGIIRLGSRVDLLLPAGMVPAVREKENVLAGSTSIARPAK